MVIFNRFFEILKKKVAVALRQVVVLQVRFLWKIA